MKSQRRALLALLFVALCASARAQGSHVHSEYSKSLDMTDVYTDYMHVVDTPPQFILVQASSLFPKRKPAKTPAAVRFEIGSFAGKRLYRADARVAKKVVINADGEAMTFDRPAYRQFKGKNRKGKIRFAEVEGAGFMAAFASVLGDAAYRSPLPEDAQIRGAEGVKELRMEVISVRLPFEQLTKLAAARKVSVELEGVSFTLTESHLQTLREFARRVSP